MRPLEVVVDATGLDRVASDRLERNVAPAGAARVTLVAGAPPAHLPRGWRLLEPDAGATALALEHGHDVLWLDARAVLLERTVDALRLALSAHPRTGAVSAFTAATEVFRAPDARTDEGGEPTPDARAAERLVADRAPLPVASLSCAATLVSGEALAVLGPLRDVAVSGWLDGVGLALESRGFVLLASPAALVATPTGVALRPRPAPDPLARGRLEARRADDARRVDLARVGTVPAGRLARRPRVALDLAAVPLGSSAMNGTRRLVAAFERALGAVAWADVTLVRDWSAVPAGAFDVAFRPTHLHSTGHLRALLCGARTFAWVLPDLIALGCPEPFEGLEMTEAGPRVFRRGFDAHRAATDLGLEAAWRTYALTRSVRDEACVRLAGRPARERVRAMPVASLRREPPPAEPVPELEGRTFFLWVGNAARHKNLVQAVEAHAGLGPDAPRLVAVGATPGDVAAASRGLAHAPRPDVACLQDVPEARLEWLYRGCRAFVWTSLAEGLGLPLVEATRAGAPILVARTAVNHELLGGEVPGSFRTTEELRALLRAAVADPGRFRLPPIPAAGDAELTAWLEAELREALGEGTLPPPPVLIPEETATPREARRAVVWVGRRLERLPLLWRLGRRFVSLVRGARPT